MAILNVLNCLVVNYEGLTQTTLKTLYIGLCDVAYSSFLFRGGGYVKNAFVFSAAGTEEEVRDALLKEVDTALKTNHVDDSEYAVRTGSQVANSIAGWLSTITLAALIFAGISL
ncbi:MAG: hypothetical protein EOM50_23450, partial [Erysipelotrichia bacterium]|nr:hypothetical protein [Erysipelotrichia bacterium]